MKMNKTTISLALGALIFLGSIFYFSNNEKENKVLVNTKTETSLQKEKVEKTNKKETSKTEVKKEDNNPRGPVIYKNTSENEGYNMELKVPAKWVHLDYSRLGQPEEVALKPEEYLAGDQLYTKDDPLYYKEGKFYLSAKEEKILLDIFQDRKTLDLLFGEISYIDSFEFRRELENFSDDINNLIEIDEKTGLKVFKQNPLGILYGTYWEWTYDPNGTKENDYRIPKKSFSIEQNQMLLDFMEQWRKFGRSARHENIALREKEDKEVERALMQRYGDIDKDSDEYILNQEKEDEEM